MFKSVGTRNGILFRFYHRRWRNVEKTIVRGISKAISDKQDVLNLILSNLAYAVTGEDDTLEMYAIEKQLKTLSGIMDETMELAASSTGDGKRFQEEMKSLSSQMVVLREQLEIIKGRIDSNKKVNEEIENIKQCLSADSLDFSEYNDAMISSPCWVYSSYERQFDYHRSERRNANTRKYLKVGMCCRFIFNATPPSFYVLPKWLEKYDETWYNTKYLMVDMRKSF